MRCGSKVDVLSEIQDIDPCTLKSAVKLTSPKKQTLTHAAKLMSQIKHQTTTHARRKNMWL